MKIKISDESIGNYERGIISDCFCGILTLNGILYNTIFLAQCDRRDNVKIGPDRRSIIRKEIRKSLPGAGGHAELAQWAGLKAKQDPTKRAASGEAVGFTIKKNVLGPELVGTKSGLNTQYTSDEGRELPVPFRNAICMTIMAQLATRSSRRRR